MSAFGTTTRRSFVQALALFPALDGASVSAAVGGRSLIPSADLSLTPGLIHLNTASAGPTPNRVLERMIAAWRQLETDPVAQSYSDRPDTVFTAADQVRGKAAALLGCGADEMLFTRGTTDGITTLAQSVKLNAGDRILLSNLEHEGGEVGWLHREKISGVLVDRVHLPYEEHDPQRIVDAYAAALTPKTRVISVSHVLAPTGLRMPVAQIARLARSRGVLCVVDGAQAVGHISVDVRSIGCDAYATSGHKWLMGPKGTGLVYIAKDAAGAFDPPQWRLGRRVGSDSAGLAPLTMAVGLGVAIDTTRTLGISRIETYNRGLADIVYAEMTKMPQLRVVSPAPGASSTAMVAAMLPPAIDADRLRAALRERHSIVIKLAEKRWFNGIRLSPHVFNDEVQVVRALAALRTELGR
ncbi:MAG: aminotransferase class V-fold PLP-dependent enzyme [Vicinamibacterales bacterium]